MCNSVNPDYNIKTRKQSDGVRFLLLLREFNISNQCWLQEPCSGDELHIYNQCWEWILLPRALHIFNQCWQGRDSSHVAERVAHFQPVFVKREILSYSWESYICSSGIGNRKRILSYGWESCIFSTSAF